MNQALITIIIGLTGFIVAVGSLPALIRYGRNPAAARTRLRELHHSHSDPVSRIGGAALAVAFVVICNLAALLRPDAATSSAVRLIIMGGCLAIFIVGFWDDLKPLGARRKLLLQVAIASVVWLAGIRFETLRIPFLETTIQMGWMSWLPTVVWLVAMTNLINLIDGIDGLAGGISLFLMVLLAVMGQGAGNLDLMAIGMIGALIGFLVFNFPPAKIYLGDGGAYLLGFYIGITSLATSQKGTVLAALIAPLFVLALPILDTTLALVRRGLKGLPLFRPDQKHLHHRLVQSGLSHRRVVLGMYAVTLVFLVLGLITFSLNGRYLPVLVGVGMCALLLCASQFQFSRRWFDVKRLAHETLGMRHEVAYAMSVMRWLKQEGRRVHSVDEFWGVLSFAVQGLGFSSLTVRLNEEERTWKSSDMPPTVRTRSFDFDCDGVGWLEVQAAECAFHGEPLASTHCVIQCERKAACIGNKEVFEIVSDLVAESWHHAIQELRKEQSAQVSFDTTRLRRVRAQPGLFNRLARLLAGNRAD